MSQKKIKKLRKRAEIVSSVPANIVDENLSIKSIITDNWKFLLIMIIGAVVLFWNGMNGDFVSDDYATIPQNPDITSISRTLDTMPNLVNLSNTFIAKIFGVQSSAPFHIFNLIILIFTLVSGFIFIYLLMGRFVAWITLAIFTVHPIHVEAITWIAGRPYSMFSPFAFMILNGLLMYFYKRNKAYLWLSIAILPFIYKTDAVRTLGLILFVIPLVVIYAGVLKGIKINWYKLLLLVGLVGTVIVISLWTPIVNRVNIVNSGTNVSESIFYNPFFQYPTQIAKYLQLLIFPIDLTLYHTMYVFPIWLNWAIFILYFANVIYFLFKDKRISFALLFIFAGTAASMAPVKVAWLVAERYIFFGSIGFCLFLAIILSEIFKKSKTAFSVIFGMILILFSIRLVMRNNDWNTNHNLWVNTCQVSPNSHNAWNNIGDDYDKFKDYDNAIKGFTQSVLVKPNYGDAYHNRANIFFKINRLDLARESYDTALRFSPGLYQTYLSLTQIDLNEKKGDLALAHATQAAELQPNDPQSQYVLGIVNAQIGRVDEARIIFQKILIAYPNYTPVVEALKQLNSIMVGKS